jgi:hypothetical protein
MALRHYLAGYADKIFGDSAKIVALDIAAGKSPRLGNNICVFLQSDLSL